MRLQSGLGGISGRWAVVLILVAFAYLVYTSSIKNMGQNIWDYDTQCWYAAGVCWWNGTSPHDPALFRATWTDIFGEPPNNQATFVYPPTMALISVPLALLPWPVAAWVFRGVSLLAFVGICVFSRKLLASPLPRLGVWGPTGIYVALAMLLGSVVQALHQGQCALIVVCGCLCAWHGYQRRLLGLFLVGFLVATIKPQISMIPLIYFIFAGGYRWFIYGAAVSIAFSVFMILIVPLPELVAAYESSMKDHLQHQEFNQWYWYSSAPALLGKTPWGKEFMLMGVVLGVLGAAWVGWRQRQYPDTLRHRIRHYQLMWVIAIAAMPIHLYDVVGHVFLTISLWILPDWRRRVLAFACMFIGDKAYGLAWRVSQLGEGFQDWFTIVQTQCTSLMSLVLLVLFVYWYGRDYREKRRAK